VTSQVHFFPLGFIRRWLSWLQRNQLSAMCRLGANHSHAAGANVPTASAHCLQWQAHYITQPYPNLSAFFAHPFSYGLTLLLWCFFRCICLILATYSVSTCVPSVFWLSILILFLAAMGRWRPFHTTSQRVTMTVLHHTGPQTTSASLTHIWADRLRAERQLQLQAQGECTDQSFFSFLQRCMRRSASHTAGCPHCGGFAGSWVDFQYDGPVLRWWIVDAVFRRQRWQHGHGHRYRHGHRHGQQQ